MFGNRFKILRIFIFFIFAIANGQINVTIVPTQVSCNGFSDGAAEVTPTPTGGTAPYTYLWSNGQATAKATGLSAGNYNVTVTDKSLPIKSTTKTITITEPTKLTATAVQNSGVKCKGESNGSATVTVTGGTIPYTYSWDKSASTSATVTDLAAGLHTITITDKNGCTITAQVTITEPTKLTATAVQNSGVKCKGESNGSATVTVTGGTTPYKSYSWDKSTSASATASDLSAGLHTITIKDANNCEIKALVNITEPEILTATTIQDSQVKCKGAFNGEATVTVIGGTTPYTYAWDKSTSTSATATDLGAGFHTIKIKDKNGCLTMATVTITEPAILTATAVETSSVNCKGGSDGVATVTVLGGTAPYDYTWNKSSTTSATATDLVAGLHTITIKDLNNCVTTAFITINEPANNLTATAIQNSAVSCFGGADGVATVNVSGGTIPYTYVWQNSSSTIDKASDLTAGVHDITIRDAKGCEITIIVFINEPAILTATAAQYKPVVCNGDSNGSAVVTASGGTLPYRYFWDKSNSISAVASDLASGIHTVTVKDKNDCETTAIVVISEPALLSATAIQDSPVKCKGASNGKATVTVVGGSTPYTYVWQNSSSTTDTASDLSAGTHIITIKDANGCKTTASIVITEPTVLAATAIQNNQVKCKGEANGSATVTATGGITPYTYSWDKSISTSAIASDLKAGTHTIKVIDGNGCETTTTVIITEPPVLTATATEVSPVKCKGAANGVATVFPVGGIGPNYTFAWDKSTSTSATATDLIAGLHTITIYDANDCKTTATVTIMDTYSLTATAVQFKPVSCNGKPDGSAVVTVSGGKTPYTYSWDKSISTIATASDLKAGTHTITIRDANACEITTTVLITEPPMLTATATQDSPVKCKGANNGIATVTVVGGTIPYTYSWDKSTSTSATATNLVAGLHTVKIKDAKGCETSITVTITEPNALALTETVLPITCDKGGSISVQVTGGVSTSYFYDWTGPSSFAQSGANLKSITNLRNEGTYKLTVSDNNGCSIIKYFTLKAYVPLEYTGPTAIEFDTCDSTPTYGIDTNDIRGGIPYIDSNGNPYYNYEWFGPNNYHSNEAIIPIGVGNYICVISDSQNCKSNPISFTITTPYSPIVVTETISDVSCDAENKDGYIAIAITGGKFPYNIKWEKEIPSTTQGNTNPSYTAIGQNILRVNNLMEGRYRLTVTSNLFSCSDSNPAYKFQTIYTVSTQNSIRILENPVLDSKLCAGISGTLTVKVIDEKGGPVNFYYNGLVAKFEDLGNSNYLVYIDNPVPNGILNIVNQGGCGETVVINISVVTPTFDISSIGYNMDGIVNLNEAVTFINTSSGAFSRLEWNFGDDSPIDETDQPKHAYDISGIYDATLRLYNEFDCYKETTLQIKVGSGNSVRFPDIFTPNNDGINDYFEAGMIGIARFDFEVYDLWNNLIYTYNHTSGSINNNWGWDGNLPNGSAYTGKIFKYVFIGYDYSDKRVIIKNQALLLR